MNEQSATKESAGTRVSPVAMFRGVVGAFLGGLIGYFVTYWLGTQGYYTVIIPGALLGLGCGLASRVHSIPLGAFSGIAGLGLGIIAEWRIFSFHQDNFGEFLKGFGDLGIPTYLMLVFGTVMAFWFGRGR